MSNLLTFLDGATYASLWTTGPFLLSSILLEEGSSSVDITKMGRPISSHQAIDLASTIFSPLINPNSKQDDGLGGLWESIPSHMAFIMVAYLIGHALGSHVGENSSVLNILQQRMCPRRMRILSSNRILTLLCSLLVSLLLLNWGFQISTYSGWVVVRFLTAFINGALGTWGKRYFHHSKVNIDESDLEIMEEGKPFLSEDEDQIVNNSQRVVLVDSYWLIGVASSTLFSGFTFYLMNRIISHDKFFALIIFIGSIIVLDRFVSMCYKKNTTSKRCTSSISICEDEGIDQMTAMSKPGLIHRTKQSNPLVRQTPTPRRTRMNSMSSVESEIFFDCMDDITLGFEAEEKPRASSLIHSQDQNVRQDKIHQIAIYSNRRVVYSDNTVATIPVGEKSSVIPHGYKILYGNNALSHYQQTQDWRREQQIHRIHTLPHLWYPKIKLAYPHFIHGFSKNGMPVIYESPGKMNLKELFRNGCHVDDMVFHYCYLMEYLSNLESILTELHSELNSACGDEWQEELASYAHSKQFRLQNDNVSFGFVVVMDISGASPALLSGDVMTYLSRAGEINSLHYPGSMRRAIAVQAPFWLGAAWGAIKGVMPASVTVDLLSAAKTVEGGLKEYIDEEQIPVEYGGKSKFKVGEHPFEIGLQRLVETQPSNDMDDDKDVITEMKASVQDETQTSFFNDMNQVQSKHYGHSKTQNDGRTTTHLPNSQVLEWDDLDSDYVLAVATLLFALKHMMIGGIELALPLIFVIPPMRGLGFDVISTAVTIFATCMTILLLMKSTQFSSRVLSIAEKSPLSAFRISLGSSSFFWLCASIVLSILPTNESVFRFCCLVVSYVLTFFSGTLGITAVSYIRKCSTEAFADEKQTLPKWCSWIQYDHSTPRVAFFAHVLGIIIASPMLRWSFMMPFTGTCFIVLACIYSFIYVVSFALHSVTHSPQPVTTGRRRNMSQFATVLSGMWWFVKDLVLVAIRDTKFLAQELRKVGNK